MLAEWTNNGLRKIRGSITIPSLKEISPSMSESEPCQHFGRTKLCNKDSLPWILIGRDKLSMKLIRPTSLSRTQTPSILIENFVRLLGLKFHFLEHLWPWMKSEATENIIKIQSLTVCIIIPSLNKICSLTSKCMPMLKFWDAVSKKKKRYFPWFIPNKYLDVYLEFLQHYIKFYSDKLKMYDTKWSQQVRLCVDLVFCSQDDGHRTWH